MTDKKISELDNGNVIQETDQIAVERGGDNKRVTVGSMATQDTEDYLTEVETEGLVEQWPDIVIVNDDLTLADPTHNGAELWVFSNGSPAAITVTIPEGLPVGFRCSIFRVGDGNVFVQLDSGISPADTLNDIDNGTADMQVQYTGAYLRQVQDGQWYIVGGGLVVS